MILASQSPRRRELLEEAGFNLVLAPADIDESRLPGESPVQLVERLAREKAEAARAALEAPDDDRLLLAADTIVWTNDDVLGKPASDKDACRMLLELSGRTHHVTTGVCLMALDAHGAATAVRHFSETTDVEFFSLNEDQVKAYVASGEPRDKAGAYGIQGKGRMLVRGIRGDYFNVVGLPIARVVRELAKLREDDGLLARLMGGAK